MAEDPVIGGAQRAGPERRRAAAKLSSLEDWRKGLSSQLDRVEQAIGAAWVSLVLGSPEEASSRVEQACEAALRFEARAPISAGVSRTFVVSDEDFYEAVELLGFRLRDHDEEGRQLRVWLWHVREARLVLGESGIAFRVLEEA